MPSVEVKNAKVMGHVIQAARQARGIKASEISERLGIAPQYLSMIENGAKNLFITRLFRIISRLGIKVVFTYDPPEDS